MRTGQIAHSFTATIGGSILSTCNVRNRTIFCDDNIDILPAINSDSVDLIYLDPPFNKNKEFTAPIGSSAEGASFKDIFREDDLKDEWLLTIEEDEPDLFHYLTGIKGVGKPYNFAYLAYMAIRLIECRRILKQKGSVYLHCDPTMSHYLKTTMDCVFGEENFRNEIVWKRSDSKGNVGQGTKHFGRQNDNLLFYAKSNKAGFSQPYVELDKDYVKKFYRYSDPDGRRYKLDNMLGPGGAAKGNPYYEVMGVSRHWRYSKERMQALIDQGRVVQTKPGTVPMYKRYLDESRGRPVGSNWADISFIRGWSKEKTGYPTQKPRALLERIISASSNEGDVVLDPFCGCATTCIAAERLGRSWIGIDISIKAYELVQERLAKETASIFEGDVVVDLKTDPPARTDQAGDYKEQKYVYVISHPNFPGEYKVGIAKNWSSKWKRRGSAKQSDISMRSLITGMNG